MKDHKDDLVRSKNVEREREYICQAERMKREAKRTRPRKEKNPICTERERRGKVELEACGIGNSELRRSRTGAEIIEGKPKMVKFSTPNSNAKKKNELYIYITSNSFSFL